MSIESFNNFCNQFETYSKKKYIFQYIILISNFFCLNLIKVLGANYETKRKKLAKILNWVFKWLFKYGKYTKRFMILRIIDNCFHIPGVMIGRGALIKPWIFKEIKEEKHWDITSSERFDILKEYVNYGLEHWGSDNEVRNFILEIIWSSYLI